MIAHGKGAQKTLGIELEATLPPSRRHPEGAARCQAVTRRDGQPRQCRRKARDGFRVCSHHGAGSRKRELEGVKQNPALAPLTTGERATPSTLQQLWRGRPELKALYEKHIDSDDLLDMRPVLAQAKALAEWLMSQLDPAVPDSENGSPLAIRAIQALSHVMRAARDMLDIEQRLGPVTHAELRKVTHGVAATIEEFVPPERRDEAFAFLRQKIAGGNRSIGGVGEQSGTR